MKRNSGAGRLFLVELVINLCLFAVCAAACVALLLHARAMSRESTLLTHAVYAAQDMAEMWKAGGQPQRWTEDAYGLTGVLSQAGGAATVTISQGDKVIYVLEGVERLE